MLGWDLQTSMFSTLPPLNSTDGGPAGAAYAAPAISAGPAPRAATTRILGIARTGNFQTGNVCT